MSSASADAPPPREGGAPNPTPTSRGGRGEGNRGRGSGRGRGSNRGRGRGDGARGRGRGRGNPANPSDEAAQSTPATQASRVLDFKSRAEPQQGDEDGEVEVCFICANPVSHLAIAPCNHITCHICALRLRALYKSKDCPHCRTAAPFVIFTDDAAKRFESYTDSDTTSTDNNIGIRYVNEDIVGDTVLLLRYNCPDPSCDFAGLGWPDLHRHVRSAHHKKMCDLCTRNKKVFTHEHELFTDKELENHMRRGDDRPGAIDQTGFKGHPLCDFCGERFYDSDKLYEHCRNKHERCFICDRRDSRQPHYYRDYNALERHFRKDHFPCLDRECQEKKFVVFESEMDLKAHQLSEHADSLSKDVRRDARLVDMSSFDYRPSYQHERRGGQSSRESRGGRGRDPNAEQTPAPSSQALRRDELAFQRQMAIHSAQSVTPRTFGGQLSGASGSSRPNQAAQPSATQSTQPVADAMETLTVNDLSAMTPEQRASLARHGSVIQRASALLGNDSSKTNAFRSHVSSYNRGSVTAEQLIDAFFAVFAETSSNALGTLVREVADLFEDKNKAEALRKAWQNWRAINEDYPSLPGLGGMHGATTSSSGWANAAAASPTTAQNPANAAAQQKHSTRVLRLKNSTRRGSAAGLGPNVPSSAGGSSAQAPAFSRAVAPSAPVSAAFPALPSTSAGQRTAQPSWVGSTGSSSTSTASRSATTPSFSTGTSIRRPAGTARGGEEAFPALPAAPKPLTTIFGYGRGAVRRDFGGARESGFSWGGSAESDTGPARADAAGDEDAGKKGGKKKKKQVLAQWG